MSNQQKSNRITTPLLSQGGEPFQDQNLKQKTPNASQRSRNSQAGNNNTLQDAAINNVLASPYSKASPIGMQQQTPGQVQQPGAQSSMNYDPQSAHKNNSLQGPSQHRPIIDLNDQPTSQIDQLKVQFQQDNANFQCEAKKQLRAQEKVLTGRYQKLQLKRQKILEMQQRHDILQEQLVQEMQKRQWKCQQTMQQKWDIIRQLQDVIEERLMDMMDQQANSINIPGNKPNNQADFIPTTREKNQLIRQSHRKMDEKQEQKDQQSRTQFMLISGKQGMMMEQLERAAKAPADQAQNPEYFLQRITHNLEEHQNKLLKIENERAMGSRRDSHSTRMGGTAQSNTGGNLYDQLMSKVDQLKNMNGASDDPLFDRMLNEFSSAVQQKKNGGDLQPQDQRAAVNQPQRVQQPWQAMIINPQGGNQQQPAVITVPLTNANASPNLVNQYPQTF